MRIESPISSLCKIKIRNDGILEILLVEDSEYDKDQVEAVVKYLNEITEGKKYKILVVAGSYSNITLNSLKVLSEDNAMTYASSKAYVISSLPQKLMARFYLNVFKPKIPIKFFDKLENAENWLLSI